jgi:hypothetical protein
VPILLHLMWCLFRTLLSRSLAVRVLTATTTAPPPVFVAEGLVTCCCELLPLLALLLLLLLPAFCKPSR